MGIYDDIQNDVGEALLDDLSDAYISFTVVEMTGEPVYSPVSGTYTQSENPQSCMGVNISEMLGENFDKPDRLNSIEMLVLDKDKPFTFAIGQRIEMDSGRKYKISGILGDPAGATWTLSGRIWGG